MKLFDGETGLTAEEWRERFRKAGMKDRIESFERACEAYGETHAGRPRVLDAAKDRSAETDEGRQDVLL
jgi:hypothetical protein